MDLFNDFINTYGTTIIYTIITALFGYIGLAIKKLYTKYVNDKTKADVIKTCVQAVEQIYKDLHGDEKLEMCIGYAQEMLEEKGIIITDIEIRMMIEAAVNEFNDGFNKDVTDNKSESQDALPESEDCQCDREQELVEESIGE